MDDVIPFTKELRKIVEDHKWTFYQIPPACPPWDEVERRGPAEYLEVGHQCIFAPIPESDQTLREAYSVTKGLGPSLVIDSNWTGIEEIYKGAPSVEREDEILFSRIWFPNPRCSVLISPKTRDTPDPSSVSIKMQDTLETFRRYFRIVSPAEYGLTVPISMPFHPEDN